MAECGSEYDMSVADNWPLGEEAARIVACDGVVELKSALVGLGVCVGAMKQQADEAADLSPAEGPS